MNASEWSLKNLNSDFKQNLSEFIRMEFEEPEFKFEAEFKRVHQNGV